MPEKELDLKELVGKLIVNCIDPTLITRITHSYPPDTVKCNDGTTYRVSTGAEKLGKYYNCAFPQGLAFYSKGCYFAECTDYHLAGPIDFKRCRRIELKRFVADYNFQIDNLIEKLEKLESISDRYLDCEEIAGDIKDIIAILKEDCMITEKELEEEKEE